MSTIITHSLYTLPQSHVYKAGNADDAGDAGDADGVDGVAAVAASSLAAPAVAADRVEIAMVTTWPRDFLV